MKSEICLMLLSAAIHQATVYACKHTLYSVLGVHITYVMYYVMILPFVVASNIMKYVRINNCPFGFTWGT